MNSSEVTSKAIGQPGGKAVTIVVSIQLCLSRSVSGKILGQSPLLPLFRNAAVTCYLAFSELFDRKAGPKKKKSRPTRKVI